MAESTKCQARGVSRWLSVLLGNRFTHFIRNSEKETVEFADLSEDRVLLEVNCARHDRLKC